MLLCFAGPKSNRARAEGSATARLYSRSSAGSPTILIGQHSSANQQSLPPVTGKAAIAELKQQGSYESLLEALASENPRYQKPRVPADPARENIPNQPLSAQGVDWPLEAQLLADSLNDLDHFGRSVAISGNFAIVGKEDGSIINESRA